MTFGKKVELDCENPVGATTIEKSQRNSDDNQAGRNLGVLRELPIFTC